jgi:protease I
MKQALLILAQEQYQDIEFERTKHALQEGGYEIVIASKEKGECRGKFGDTVQARFALREIEIANYDCIAFIGGPGASTLEDDPEALRIANEAAQAEMPLGAICIAPLILAKARVLGGRKATVWDSQGAQKAVLEQYGAEYTGDSVTVDGMIVTGNGPDAAEEFGRTLATL